MDASTRGDRQAWLESFAADAIIEDPIGRSISDPTGDGYRGRAAIAQYWDKTIETARPLFSLQSSVCSGNECANVGTLTLQFPNGLVAQLFGVFTYRVDDEGKITALRCYWEHEDMTVHPPLDERGA